ncbi:hypothetical protein OKW49_006212 [Paraburkholderia youngii]
MPTAPVVNANLAALLGDEPDPFEALSANQASALAWKWKLGTPPDLLKDGRLVALECGHYLVTKARIRAKCRRCGAMIRAGCDYDAFRNLGGAETFSWPGDPLRPLHETDR